MKRVLCKGILPIAAFIVINLISPQTSAKDQKYVITDLGTLGGTESFPYAINDSGQIVGYSWMAGDAGGHSFLYSNGEMTDLCPLNSQDVLTVGPKGINNAGQIASGVIVDDVYSPAIYDIRTGEITVLGSFGGFTSYGFNGVATSINSSGQTVGYSYLDNMNRHAFLYVNGVMSDIGSFGGYSQATAINDLGTIVGFASDPYDGVAHAFLYTNGVMTDIDPVGNSDFSVSESYAEDINNQGQVVGKFLTADKNAFHCFLYSAGNMTDFGTLGGSDCVASAINEQGEVVGSSPARVYRDHTIGKPVYAWHGFLFKNGKLTDLNTLIPRDSGWELNWVFDINNQGQIVGYGTVDGIGCHAFLLEPRGLHRHQTGERPQYDQH